MNPFPAFPHAVRLIGIAGLAFALGVGTLARAEWKEQPRGAPQDWSHRHLIFSSPDTPQEAALKGKYDQWQRDFSDPRFAGAVIRKMDAQATKSSVDQANFGNGNRGIGNGNGNNGIGNNGVTNNGIGAADPITGNPAGGNGHRGGVSSIPVQRDWSNVIGGAGDGGPRYAFPAKYGFDITGTASCTNDFVVFPTNSGAATGAGNFAARTGTFTNDPGAGTVTITNGAVTLTLTRSTTVNTGLFFQTGATNIARASNLANAIARNGGTVGVTASAAGAVVTVTALSQGTGSNAITLADTISNFTWAAGTLANGTGTAGQPTIFAVNQIYKTTCESVTQAVPANFWSYNTGTGAVVDLSPILSLDGRQVAFMQREGAVSRLVLLKWSSTVNVGTVGAPTVPTSVTPAAYRACVAPCMTVMTLNGSPDNLISAPFYSYTNDTIHVGDSTGRLHKFTGVFNGTPAESGAPWPVTVATGMLLSSPVYLDSTGLVYLGSTRDGGTVGGRVHTVTNAGVVVSSAQIAGVFAGFGLGAADAPVIDSSAQRLYAFVSGDNSTTCSGGPCQAIVQFNISASIAGLAGTRVQVGRSAAIAPLFAGVFSDSYWASANPASPSGFLYVCSNPANNTSTARPTLWRITITNNVMTATVAGPQLVNNTSNAECSPITEVANGGTDRLFVGVTADGNDSGCTGACIYSFNLGGAWNAAVVASAGLPAAGGTSGIIMDNVISTPGASQVYYMTRAVPGNAIQASQNGLN